MLEGVSSTLARNIVSYRDRNGYFNTVSQLRNVSGMTPELYNRNIDYMTVCTNINTATKAELLTLIDFTEDDADEVIAYRKQQKFTNKTQLYSENVISRDTYEENVRFLSVSNKSSVN